MSEAQARITDFFTLRKRSAIAEPPSKKRKVIDSISSSSASVNSKLKKISPLRVPPSLPLTPVKSVPSKYKLDLSSPLRTTLKKKIQLSSPLGKALLTDGPGTPTKKDLGSPSKSLLLSPLEVKKRLGQVRKLSELQARLKELSSPEKKISPVQKELKFEMTTLSPQKKWTTLPPASPSKRPIPAHLRHLNLTTGLLPLPKHYKKILSIFSALDQIVSLRNNRGECIRVHEIMGPVQNVVRSEISMKHLEQIRCIFPSAFKFFWENKRGRYGSISDDFELLVIPTNESGEAISAMTPSDLVKRKTFFSNGLLGITKELHAKFLLSVDPTIKIENDKVARWHKDFNPDTFCPDVDVIRLPAKPEVALLHSVSDAMRETNKLFHSGDNVPLSPTEESPAKEAEDSKDAEEAAFQEAMKNRFKGIPPALVRKILAKEKLKVEKELVTDKKRVNELKQLDQLFDVARFLRSTFISEKKVALRMDFLLPRLLKSFSFSSAEMTQMIKCLSEVVPTFLKLINIRNTDYAKLDKNISLKLVEGSIIDHKNKN